MKIRIWHIAIDGANSTESYAFATELDADEFLRSFLWSMIDEPDAPLLGLTEESTWDEIFDRYASDYLTIAYNSTELEL